MTALPLTVLLLSVIALAQCGTLRQYGRDWLIPKPEPQVDAKRITAKSVFIAPSFGGGENVRCAAGFTRDAGGRCVKLIQVNQAAQLDFLLQRLNAMYGAPPVLSHAESKPLQVTVGIPVEPAIYSDVKPPEGAVSIDLLPSGAGQAVNGSDEAQKPANASGVPQGSSGGPQVVTSEQTDLPETENETDAMVVPSKELFQIDEEPIVMLTDDDTEEDEASTPNTTTDSDQSSDYDELFPDEEVPDKPVSIETDGAGLMAAVSKNESNVVKKETIPGKDSIQMMSGSKIKTEKVPVITTSATQSALSSDDKTVQNVTLVDKNKHISKPSTLSDGATKKPSKGDGVTYNKIENDDDVFNEVHTESSGLANGTSSKLGALPSVSESYTLLLTSSEESTESTTDVWTTNETQDSVSTVEAEDETTLTSLLYAETSDVPTLTTSSEGSSESTEQTSTITDAGGDADRVKDVDDGDGEDPVHEPDLEVGYEDLDAEGGDVDVDGSEGTTGSSAITSASHHVHDSVGGLDSASGDGGVSELEYSGDSENVRVSVNKNATVNSTNASDKTDSDDGLKFPLINGMKLDEILGFPQAIDSVAGIASGTHSHTSGGYVSHFDTSKLDRLSGEVLKTEGSVHNANIASHDATKVVSAVKTSQHSVHVVYPHPAIEVLNVKQDSHGHRPDTANTNEPKTEHQETTDLNAPPNQFHHLSPNPVQHYNSHPVPQIPLAERVPEQPRPYPPQHQNYPRPYQHPTRRPHPAGFVRFPAEPPHRPRPRPQPQTHPHAQRHGEAGNAVRFPQEDSRTNDKYSRWGNWRPDEGPDEGYWAGAENRRHYRVNNRPSRRRPQLVYYQ